MRIENFAQDFRATKKISCYHAALFEFKKISFT